MCGISIGAPAGPGFVSQDFTLFQVILTCTGLFRVSNYVGFYFYACSDCSDSIHFAAS